MKSFLGAVVVALSCAAFSDAYFAGGAKAERPQSMKVLRLDKCANEKRFYQEAKRFRTQRTTDHQLKPLLTEAVNGIKHDIMAKGSLMRTPSKLPEFFASALEEEATSKLQQFETAIHEYEKRTAEVNGIIHQATEVLRNPPMEKLNYEAIVAEDILRLTPKLQELTSQAQAALARATEAAASLNMESLTRAVATRLTDLQGRGILSWIGDIVTGGPTWIIENLASLATALSPDSSIAIYMVQHIAQQIVNAVGDLGGTLTAAGATNLLAFLGPFKEPLGHLYDQVVWSLQQTFPFLLGRK